MSGDDSLPGSDAPGSVQQPGLGLVGLQSGELQLIEEGQQRQAEAGDPSGPLTRQYLEQAQASASANNSPQPRQAVESEDADTQPPQMSDRAGEPPRSWLFECGFLAAAGRLTFVAGIRQRRCGLRYMDRGGYYREADDVFL